MDTKKRYFDLYQNAPDMYVSIGLKGAILDCNLTVLNNTGYTKEDIIGKPIFLMYSEKCLPKAQQAFQQFVKEGTVKNAELELKRKDGSTFPVLLNVSVIKDEEGNIRYSNSCWRDISELKELQQRLDDLLEERVQERTEQLEIRNKELEQFAYVASHDLQEPLRTIQNFTGLLEEEYAHKLNAEAIQYLDFVCKSTKRMSKLIQGLLDYSRIGNSTESAELFDCNALITTIIEDLDALILINSATIEIEYLPIIQGNQLNLQIVFQNLISNAIKFQKKNIPPHIKITSRKVGNYWEFSITDNGIGIEEKYWERIFIIYQRLHDQETYAGTGIGLAYCKKIIEIQGGKIWLSSKVGHGSTFYFTCPIK